MGDLKFILGFIAGWITTTEEGRKTANNLANKAIDVMKKSVEKQTETEKEAISS